MSCFKLSDNTVVNTGWVCNIYKWAGQFSTVIKQCVTLSEDVKTSQFEIHG